MSSRQWGNHRQAAVSKSKTSVGPDMSPHEDFPDMLSVTAQKGSSSSTTTGARVIQPVILGSSNDTKKLDAEPSNEKQENSSVGTPPAEYLVVLDFEAVFDKPQPSIMEIIEFPSVLIDVKAQKVISEFREYVKPDILTINPICTEATGITQEMVDTQGSPLFDVFARYMQWLEQHTRGGEATSRRAFVGSNVLFVTCGDWDVATMVPVAFAQKGLSLEGCNPATDLGNTDTWDQISQLCPLPLNLDTLYSKWCNIKSSLMNVDPGAKKFKGGITGMMGALDYLQIKHTGRHHCGIDDCRNIAAIALKMMERCSTNQHQQQTPLIVPTMTRSQWNPVKSWRPLLQSVASASKSALRKA